jgi:hypothetical protein
MATTTCNCGFSPAHHLPKNPTNGTAGGVASLWRGIIRTQPLKRRSWRRDRSLSASVLIGARAKTEVPWIGATVSVSDQAPCLDWPILHPRTDGRPARLVLRGTGQHTALFPLRSRSSIITSNPSLTCLDSGVRRQRCMTAKLPIDAIRNDCLKSVADKPSPLLRCPSLWITACDATCAGVSRRQRDIAPSQH